MEATDLFAKVYRLLDILECAPVVVREYTGCYLIFYQLARFLQTGEDSQQLAGNHPILAIKATGELYYYLNNDPDDESDMEDAGLLLPIDKILSDLL